MVASSYIFPEVKPRDFAGNWRIAIDPNMLQVAPDLKKFDGSVSNCKVRQNILECTNKVEPENIETCEINGATLTLHISNATFKGVYHNDETVTWTTLDGKMSMATWVKEGTNNSFIYKYISTCSISIVVLHCYLV